MTRHDEQLVGGLTGPVYDEVRASEFEGTTFFAISFHWRTYQTQAFPTQSLWPQLSAFECDELQWTIRNIVWNTMNEIYENTVYQIVAAGSRGQSAYGGRLVAKVLGRILSNINRTWIIHVHAILQRYYYKYISRRTLSTKSVVIAYSVIGETCLQALEWRVNIAWLKIIFGRFFRIFWIFLIF